MLLPFADIYAEGGLPASSLWHPGDWYRLISYQYLHADWHHLLMNALALWVFSRGLERQLGYWRLASLYWLAGVVGGVFYCLSHLFSPLDATLIGASGSVSGIVAVCLLLQPHARLVLGVIQIPVWVLIFVWVVLQLFAFEQQTQLALLGEAANNVAYEAHLGGFVTGLLALRWLHPQWRRRRAGKIF